jgi:hypothetical protein
VASSIIAVAVHDRKKQKTTPGTFRAQVAPSAATLKARATINAKRQALDAKRVGIRAAGSAPSAAPAPARKGGVHLGRILTRRDTAQGRAQVAPPTLHRKPGRIMSQNQSAFASASQKPTKLPAHAAALFAGLEEKIAAFRSAALGLQAREIAGGHGLAFKPIEIAQSETDNPREIHFD